MRRDSLSAKVLVTGSFLLLNGLISLVQGQSAISQAILPETKAAGAEGRLNCTVLNLVPGANVVWNRFRKQGSANVSDALSINEDIRVKNPVDGAGLEKYKIYVRVVSSRESIYSLGIRRLQFSDAGTYQCMLMMPGIDVDNYPKQNGILTVQLAPWIDYTNTVTFNQVVEGGEAKLTCAAHGEPQPVISWSRANGRAMPSGQLTYFGNELTITNADTTHNGIYRCKADNNVRPPATSDITLRIRTKPVARPFRPAYGQAPDRNFQVEMACIISGDPVPELFWYRKEGATLTAINDDYKHEIHKIGGHPGYNMKDSDQWSTLRILQLQSGDFGEYMCVGRNQFGNGSAVMTLYYSPTCQGPMCDYESVTLGASSLVVSMTTLLTAIMAAAFFTRENSR